MNPAQPDSDIKTVLLWHCMLSNTRRSRLFKVNRTQARCGCTKRFPMQCWELHSQDTLKLHMHFREVLHSCSPTCFLLIFTTCTTMSYTFNHRMLKPKGKGQNQKGCWDQETTVGRQESQNLMFEVKGSPEVKGGDIRCRLRCAASRRAGCRTRNPHFQQSPRRRAWHFSPATQADACSQSGTCYFLCEEAV